MISFKTFLRASLMFLLPAAIGFHGVAKAQKPISESPGMVLKINPLSLFVSTFNVQMERRLGTRFSGQIGFAVGAPTVAVYSPNLPEPIDYKLIGLTPELRYFLAFQRRQVPHGPYLGTYLRLQHVKKSYGIVAYDPDIFQEVNAEVNVNINSLNVGFVVGYQFFIKKRLAIDLFVGPRYGFAKSVYTMQCAGCDGDESVAQKPGMRFDGLDLRAGVGVGYGFN